MSERAADEFRKARDAMAKIFMTQIENLGLVFNDDGNLLHVETGKVYWTDEDFVNKITLEERLELNKN